MVNLDPVWNRARIDLTISMDSGEPDVFLWEHSVRIAQTAMRIADLLHSQGTTADVPAVVAAGLYHDAGWAARCASGESSRSEVLIRQTAELHRDQGAVMMEQSLAELLPHETVERAAIAIRTLNDREIPIIEGQIVTEAENLDEFGVISLWVAVRRGALDGKGVKAAIDTWRRRKEYHFWSARLNDSFRIPLVREIARSRLSSMERLMEEIEAQQLAEDITVPASHAGTGSARPVSP